MFLLKLFSVVYCWYAVWQILLTSILNLKSCRTTVTLLKFSWYHHMNKEEIVYLKSCWSSQSVSHLALPYRDHWMQFFFLPKVIQLSGVMQSEPKIQRVIMKECGFTDLIVRGRGGAYCKWRQWHCCKRTGSFLKKYGNNKTQHLQDLEQPQC